MICQGALTNTSFKATDSRPGLGGAGGSGKRRMAEASTRAKAAATLDGRWRSPCDGPLDPDVLVVAIALTKLFPVAGSRG